MVIKRNRRQTIITALSMLTASVAACRPNPSQSENKSMQPSESKDDFVYLDVSIYNYLDRTIFDVYLNKKDIGVARAFGGGGLMTGVKVPLGPQTVSWRLDGPEGMEGNGDRVHAANTLVLEAPPATHRYLGVHIYPDYTVELLPEEFWPEATERGRELYRQWKVKNGK